MGRLSFGKKLKLILWKNWHALFYHWKHLVFCLFITLIFALILVFLRVSAEPKKIEMIKYEPINLGYQWRELLTTLENRHQKLQPLPLNCYMPRIAIAFAPSTSNYVNAIMEKAVTEYLYNVELVRFATISELHDAMTTEHYLVGVKFEMPESVYHQLLNTYPQTLSFSLVYPSELRIWDSAAHVGDNWRTYELFDSLNEQKHRNPKQNDGGFVGYVREGFASVQNAISMAYISLRSPKTNLPEMTIQRFPYMADINDELHQNARDDVVFLLIIGFLYPCMFISLSINRDKGSNLMAFFRIMGINYKVQLIAWFIISFSLFFTCSLFFIGALKIHWYNGFAILTKSSWSAVLFLLIAYNLASVSFTYMVTACFVRNSTATLMLVLFWILTYIPSELVYPNGTFTMQLLTCIFSNCCINIAFDQLIKFELLGHGFQWSDFMDDKTFEMHLTNGVLTMFLFTLSLIYLFIGLIIYQLRLGLLEIPTCVRNTSFMRKIKWLHPEPFETISTTATMMRYKRMSKAFEINPDSKKTYVEILGLTKVYQGKTVVNDFKLNMFESEIMVLMGHNGSGKTTLLSMITGMIKPSKGTVKIGGVNIRKYPVNAFENLGVCLQDDILVPELNVSNQIAFHCRMKGLSEDQLDIEVKKYLMAMNIYEYSDQATGELSTGLKRFLSVCCALCAGSKFVVLDEPDTGMDILIRRQFRELILAERSDRTILMTTHSTTEADSLSDRIAIISGGSLKCYGTTTFLRKIYCNGFNLICQKNELCDSSVVTAAIQKFLPNRLIPESIIGTELSYRLDIKDYRAFHEILNYLEQNYDQLNLISVSIGEASIDDVFLSMGAENPGEGDRIRMSQILNGISSINLNENLRFLNKTDNYKGFKLLKSQWKALLLKRFLFNSRIKPVMFLQCLMPLIFTALSFPLENRLHTGPTLPTMTYRLSLYPESITVLDIREDIANEFIPRVITHYEEIIMTMGVGHKILKNRDLTFDDFIIDIESEKQNDAHLKYLIAATFKHNEVKAWFNNYPLHTVPLTLNIMHNALLRAVVNNTDAWITVDHEPLPYTSPLYMEFFDGACLAINLTFCIGLVWSTSIMNLVRERRNNFKLIQHVHGVRPLSYWYTVFFYDFIWTIIISVFIMIIILCFRHTTFMQAKIAVKYFFTLALFGTLILPFNYALSYVSKDHMTTFCVVTIFSFLGGASYFTLAENVNNPIHWLYYIIPHFSLCSILYKIYGDGKIHLMCLDEIYRKISMVLDNCESEPNCCDADKFVSWSKYDIIPEVISIVLISACSVATVIVLELRGVNKAGIFNPTIPEDDKDAEKEDYINWHRKGAKLDVSGEQERMRVLNLKPREYFEKPLILKAVGCIRNHITQLHRLFLVVNRSECLGVFGTSTTGRTAFMKMLVDNSASSYGQIYVNGLSLRSYLYEVYDQIGYCQQISSNLDDFYGCEVLKIFCMFHGIPHDEIEPISESLAKAFGYWPKYKQRVKFYTPGTKRLFRISIALLGNPSIVYMDEPMMGLDLAALRKLCYIICRLRNVGTSVLFASLRFGVSELCCSRISFLNGNRLTHIETPHDLAAKHFKGYLVKLKIKTSFVSFLSDQKKSNESVIVTTPNPFLKLQTFMETAFPHAVMKEQRGKLMYFLIPRRHMKISHIFEELFRNSVMLNIETFLVTQNTLSLFYFEAIERSIRLSRA